MRAILYIQKRLLCEPKQQNPFRAASTACSIAISGGSLFDAWPPFRCVRRGPAWCTNIHMQSQRQLAVGSFELSAPVSVSFYKSRSATRMLPAYGRPEGLCPWRSDTSSQRDHGHTSWHYVQPSSVGRGQRFPRRFADPMLSIRHVAKPTRANRFTWDISSRRNNPSDVGLGRPKNGSVYCSL